MAEKRKQGIFVNADCISVEASATLVKIVDRGLRAARASARLEVWSRGRLVNSATYGLPDDLAKAGE